MQPTYADVHMLLAEREERWKDRAPEMPLLGFVLGTGISLLLWSVIGWSAWVLLA